MKMSVRKTGAKGHPWQARCPECTGETLHFHPDIGVVVVNDRVIGNRAWVLAMIAAYLHIEEVHNDRTTQVSRAVDV